MTAVSAQAVSKSFRLPHERYLSVRDTILHPFSRRDYDVLPALRDVSFEVERGETFGIVGRNGSGKSTLLKCISGIYRADAGSVRVDGRLAPFIELGVGFNPELSARDNAVVNAVMLGLTPREARERLAGILEFAELEQFADLKLKNFSSGMTLRLAFAVTVQVDAEVLVFDEVLRVGDASFQEKCMAHFEKLRAEGRTIVVVTHDMRSVVDLCDRALLLDEGRVRELGDPAAVARAYEQVNAEAPHERSVESGGRSPARSGVAPRTARTAGAAARRVATVARTLAAAEFKVKYLDAALSYLWVLMGPLAFFAILYVVFSQIGTFDEGVEHYHLYLLSSLVLWMFFAEATAAAVGSLVKNEGLLRRVPIPHAAIPLSVVAKAFFDLVMSSLAVLVFVLAAGVTPRLSWLELVPIVAFLCAFVVGAALLLAALFVRFRDVDHVWTLLRQLLFYSSPIFYVVASVPESLRDLVLTNPLAAVFTELRHAVIDPAAPSWVEASGGGVRALVPVAIVAITFAVGVWVFRRESPTVAENL